MTIQEIRAAVIGKTYSYYDSFNGSSEYLKNISSVDFEIKMQDQKQWIDKIYGYKITGEDSWERKKTIFIERKRMCELVTTGKIETHYEIDHCSCTTYEIK